MTSSDILIVEDEPDIAELIRFHSEREGCQARVVGSGRLALDAPERRRISMIRRLRGLSLVSMRAPRGTKEKRLW